MKLKHVACMIMMAASLLCTWALAGEPANKPFSHKPHEEEVDCAECHQMDKATGKQSFPEITTCQDCHEDLTDHDAVHKKTMPSPAHLSFSHDTHKKLECDMCHVVPETGPLAIPGFSECERCHSSLEVKATCKDCHDGPFEPDYHGNVWPKRHGNQPGLETTMAIHGKDCGACHDKPACMGCHRKTKPDSHTGFFKLRGHGLKAAIDGQSCRACHRESSCIQCHRKTKPLNHRGNWEYTHGFAIPEGLTGSMGKCGVCHTTSWCATCHN